MKNMMRLLIMGVLLTTLSCQKKSDFGGVTKAVESVGDEIGEVPVLFITYPKVEEEKACELSDGEEVSSTIYYKPDDSKCEGIVRKTICMEGKTIVQGDPAYSQLSCIIEPTEPPNCTQTKVLKIGMDTDKDEKVDHYIGNIASYKGELTAKKNYNYFSYSAHPQNGISPTGYAQHAYFYEGSDGLSFQFYYNIDAGGSADNQVDVDIKVTGNSLKDGVILSDDRSELKKVSFDEHGSHYQGHFHYWHNTDGGVIGPFEGEDFKIIMTPRRFGDIMESKFYSAGGGGINLTVSTDISYIIEFVEEKVCEKTTTSSAE